MNIVSEEQVMANRAALGEVDELFFDAMKVVAVAGRASVSQIQRKLRIGYPRAASLNDQLEEKGIISFTKVNFTFAELMEKYGI